MTESFPRQQARTRRFTPGRAPLVPVAPDGSRVAFLRSKSGTDPLTCLWQLHVATGQEELVADPAALDAAEGDLPAAEKARRERAREQAGGIVGYATNRDAAGGRVHPGRPGLPDRPGRSWAARAGPPQEIAVLAPGRTDARPDPDGQAHRLRVHAARCTSIDVPRDRPGQGTGRPGGHPGLSFGLAEFIAAEEMGRMRGYWWAPDGSAVLTARVDERPVQRWHIADPANPAPASGGHRLPAAGTANADVSLLLARLDGSRTEVSWDRAAFPYLATVSWDAADPLLVVQSRDQRRMQLRQADPATGQTTLIREDTDPKWVDIVPGVPARTSDGQIVWTADAEGARRLLLGTADEHRAGAATAVTPASLQVRDVLGTDGNTVLFTASGAEPAEIGLWLYRAETGAQQLSPPGGVHDGARTGGSTVMVSRTLAEPGPTVQILQDAATPHTARIAVRAETAQPAAAAAGPVPGGPRADPHRAAAAVLAPAGRGPAAGAARPVRRPARATRAGRPGRVPDLAVAGRAGLRGAGGGRPGHPGPRPGLGPGGVARPGRPGAGRPDHRAARGRRAAPGPGPQPGGHPRLVVRRLPGRAGRAAPPGRVPRRGGGRTGHRLGAV